MLSFSLSKFVFIIYVFQKYIIALLIRVSIVPQVGGIFVTILGKGCVWNLTGLKKYVIYIFCLESAVGDGIVINCDIWIMRHVERSGRKVVEGIHVSAVSTITILTEIIQTVMSMKLKETILQQSCPSKPHHRQLSITWQTLVAYQLYTILLWKLHVVILGSSISFTIIIIFCKTFRIFRIRKDLEITNS